MSRTGKISASLICADLLELAEAVDALAKNGADIVHIDVMDNQFVHGFGFSTTHVKAIHGRTSLPLDIHLMASPSAAAAIEFADAGADRVFVHVEAADAAEAAEAVLASSASLGLAIKPDTPLELLTPHCDQASAVLVFTTNPGRRGQEMRSDALQRVSAVRTYLKARNPTCELHVDGGVYAHSIGQLRRAGADVFIVGSAYFGPDGRQSPAQLVRSLRGQLGDADTQPS